MIYEELIRECSLPLDDMKLTPRREKKPEKEGGGEIVRFYHKEGHELCVYVDIDENAKSLLDSRAFFYDFEETVTKAGDFFRFVRNMESVGIDSYAQLGNILWAHRYQYKSCLPDGTREFQDEDLLALILELQRQKIPHDLQIVSRRPRISFTRNGEEIASARKSVGRLRYQNVAGEVSASKGVEGDALKDFISSIVSDIQSEICEIKKIR